MKSGTSKKKPQAIPVHKRFLERFCEKSEIEVSQSKNTNESDTNVSGQDDGPIEIIKITEFKAKPVFDYVKTLYADQCKLTKNNCTIFHALAIFFHDYELKRATQKYSAFRLFFGRADLLNSVIFG